MIELKKYYPIDKDKVKKRWNEIINIPNDQWYLNDVDKKIDVINDEGLPNTLRTLKLNMLPALVIEILNNN